MLQQTQAARVVNPYERFIDRFPTPKTAADSSTGELLAVWVGLGYNSRALWLREAARMIVADGWPTTMDGLRSLPGVGPYTAAAVACFAFGRQVPAVDTNLRRVLSRWVGRALDKAELAATATDLLPDGAAVDWNQAVMDLGAGICRPKPDCGTCPVATWCAGPDVYVPPRPQGRFEGSVRQARGSILKTLVAHDSIDRDDLFVLLPGSRVEKALGDLIDEGVVVDQDGRVALAT
jgi:A/G-specific adenine glycosylase